MVTGTLFYENVNKNIYFTYKKYLSWRIYATEMDIKCVQTLLELHSSVRVCAGSNFIIESETQFTIIA